MDERVSYEDCYRGFLALESPAAGDSNGREHQQRLQRALALLRQALRQRQLDGVLSENEPFFELQNTQLYAFCLEYFLAMLIPKLSFFQEDIASGARDQREGSSTDDSDSGNADGHSKPHGIGDQERNVVTRIQFLREADVFHTQFLDRAEQSRILTDDKRREQYERMESKKFSLSRDDKIARFKMQRELEKKLEVVQQRRQRAQRDASANATSEDVDDEEDALEEVEREQLMTFIQLAVVRSMDEQASINQERDMLETMAAMNARSESRNLFSDAHRPPPPQQGQGISVTHINPQFEMRRETIRSETFQPGHRLPTMSLDEYADREMADAMARQEREQAAEGPNTRRYEQLVEDGDEDDAALLDEATYKDRAWDDYKDANPRGIGNKKGSQF